MMMLACLLSMQPRLFLLVQIEFQVYISSVLCTVCETDNDDDIYKYIHIYCRVAIVLDSNRKDDDKRRRGYNVETILKN